MRQIVLDTETTGLDPATGHRVLEIGCVELFNRRLTGATFHCYLNPGRESDDAALEVHGLTSEFLSDKPVFAQVADDLLAFVKDAEVIIHNAPFDLAFLDAELGRLGGGPFRRHVTGVVDSLVLAKERHPGKRNNLNSLCERYGVSNAHRTLHGALLDGQLLAEVYLAMTRGQDALGMDLEGSAQDVAANDLPSGPMLTFVKGANPDEVAAHAMNLAAISMAIAQPALWDVG